MLLRWPFRPRIRHPFCPGPPATLARDAKGPCVTLAGTFLELVKAAQAGVRVRRAAFVLLYESGPFLSDAQRDELWELLEVPVFAMLLANDGRLLAYECEAQSGLHVGPNWPAGSRQYLLTAPCECGRPGERILLGTPESTSATAAD